MAQFNPQPNDKVTINSAEYRVAPHPSVPTMAFGQAGRKATVYQLRQNGKVHALKIFSTQFRQPQLVETCNTLAQLDIAGLEVCKRQCFTKSTAAALIRQYPEMEYAVLMPWVQGATWFDMLVAGSSINQDMSKALAQNTANVLVNLEQRGFAHCDVAGPNVVVNTNTGSVSFIDVEDMYGPGLSLTAAFPRGTDGYQHKSCSTLTEGQWSMVGDRFSAAILLAEMLAWHNPEVRRVANEEHYFPNQEMQDPDSPNYKVLLETLHKVSKQVADCFAEAWQSTTLADCPPLSKWEQVLKFPVVEVWMPISVPPPPPLYTLMPLLIEPQPAPPPYQTTFSGSLVDKSMQNPIGLGPLPTYVPLAAPSYAYFQGDVLAWWSVPDAEGYIVEVADNEVFNDSVEVYRGKDLRWNTAGQLKGEVWVRICAYNKDGNGAWRVVKQP